MNVQLHLHFVQVLEVQPVGKKTMSVGAFRNGIQGRKLFV